MKKAFDFVRRQFTWPECATAAILFVLLFIDRSTARDNLMGINIKGWIWYFYALIPWFALSLVPMLALGKWSRYAYYIILPVIILCESILLFVRINFNMQLDGDIVGIVLASSEGEIKWFFSQYFGPALLMVAAAVLCLVTFSAWIASRLMHAAVSKFKVICSMAAALLFFILLPVFSEGARVFDDLPFVFLITDSVAQFSGFQELASMKSRPKLPQDIARAEELGANSIGVFVLGESATRNRWSLYGYGRKTTPCLDGLEDELVAFDNVVAPVSSTASAMKLILTTATVENADDFRYTFPQVLSKAGVRAALYSSHARFGRWDGCEIFAFAGCDPIVFTGEHGHGEIVYDDILLQYLGDRMASCTNCNSVVFLHLMGSHVSANERYPHDGVPFEPEQIVRSRDLADLGKMQNHYDNSIWFTDKILGQIIDSLKQRGGVSWMVYLSDHGETPGSNRWRWSSDRDLWEVPMVVWVSDEYKARFPATYAALKMSSHKPLQSDELLAGLLHIAGIRGGGVGTEVDFLDNRFAPRKERVIESGKKMYTWEKPQLKRD